LSGKLKSIVKHRIFAGLGKRVCPAKMTEPIEMSFGGLTQNNVLKGSQD